MTTLVRIRTLAVATGLAVLLACKSDTSREAEQAAERVREQAEDLREEKRELANEQRELTEQIAEEAEDLVGESADVAEEANQLASARDDYERRRSIRVQELRVLHSVVGTQPMLIDVLASVEPLTHAARADINENVAVFQMRLDEAGNAIEALQSAGTADFETRNDDVENALGRLEEAREDAWESLHDGDRVGTS